MKQLSDGFRVLRETAEFDFLIINECFGDFIKAFIEFFYANIQFFFKPVIITAVQKIKLSNPNLILPYLIVGNFRTHPGMRAPG